MCMWPRVRSSLRVGKPRFPVRSPSQPEISQAHAACSSIAIGIIGNSVVDFLETKAVKAAVGVAVSILRAFATTRASMVLRY